MKPYKTKCFFGILLLVAGFSGAQAQSRPFNMEYWFDNGYADRQKVSFDGNLNLEIDVSDLCYGLHSLEMRVSDTENRWGSTLLRYFVKTNPDLSGNKMSYEYWIDDSAEHHTGVTSDGSVQLDIDVSALCKGIHTLGYQMAYGTGLKSAPRLVYFLVPDVEARGGQINAYEYWFNHGSRKRVDISPSVVSLTLDNVVIAVEDVIPNRLDGYRFTPMIEQVEVDDNVFFGLQVYNANEQGSQSVLSDTFRLTLPVELSMEQLEVNTDPVTVALPAAGRMIGMRSKVTVGDSLTYMLSHAGVRADFYNASGNLIDAIPELLETGDVLYTFVASADCVYVLLYDAPDILANLNVSLVAQHPSVIHAVSSSGGTEVIHYSPDGKVIDAKQSGIHIVRMNDGSVRKVVVK